MNKPCNGCENANIGYLKSRQHHYCKDWMRQNNCDEYMRYLDRLESRRKYTKGRPILTLDALMNETMVWIFGRAQHIEAVKSLQLRTILNSIASGSIYYAVRKDNTQ